MRFAYDCDTMQLLDVHRVQDIIHGLIHLEHTASKRVMFESTENPQLFDNLTSWELPKLFRNVTGQEPDKTWPVLVTRELLGLRIAEMKPRLVDDNELDMQIKSVEADLAKKVCPLYRYALGAKVPTTLRAAPEPRVLHKPFTAAHVAQASNLAAERAAARAAQLVLPKNNFNRPWGANSACTPEQTDATVRNLTTEPPITQEMITMSTPEEIAATKAAKEQEAAAKKAAAAAEKAAKDKEKADAKAAKDAKAAEDKAAKEKAKVDAEAAKAANKLPEQNGIARPKPETLCGKAWAVFDAISAKNGAPTSIAEAKSHPDLLTMQEATIRTQYARWRKFYGVSGRVEAPKAPEAPAAPVAPEPVEA